MSAEAQFTQEDKALLVELRRDLHRHPELSWQETATQARLERALRAVGITDIQRIARTGLVARIPGTEAGAPVVAIRGDIDALPISEDTGLEYASANPGVMHACGHDVHATWAVGAALLLARHPAAGEVRVILQPAEEVGEGAKAVLESGALDGVGAIFGAHVDRRFAVGQVVAQAGPLAASADSFAVTVHGRGAHGARPHEAVDPIIAAAALVTSLQTIVSRRLEPSLPGVVTVGMFRAGSAPNVIPEHAELEGTVRATTVASRALLCGEVERMANAVASTFSCRATVRWAGGTPPLVNSATAAAIAVAAVEQVLGAQALRPLGMTNMAGEDFAFYVERMPGCFLRIGAREEGGEMIAAHSPQFHAAQSSIFIGAAVLAQCAREARVALTASEHA